MLNSILTGEFEKVSMYGRGRYTKQVVMSDDLLVSNHVRNTVRNIIPYKKWKCLQCSRLTTFANECIGNVGIETIQL